MAAEAGDNCKFTLCPLPETQRGYAIHMDKCKQDDTMCYGSGKVVVIRSFENPAIGSMFKGHKCKVNVAKFSPNGEWVASGDDQGNVIVWGAKNHIVKNEIRCCRRVLDLAWGPEGKRIAAVGDGETEKGKCFSWDSGNNLGKVDQHSKAVLSVDLKPTRPYRAVTVGEDLSMSTYAGPPFKFQASDNDYARFAYCVRYAPDGESFITVDGSSKIIQFDAKEGTRLKEFDAGKDGNHKGSIYSFAFSPDGSEIITSSSDKTCKLWNVAEGTLVKTWTIGTQVGDMQVSSLWHKDWIVSCSLSGALNYLSKSEDAPIKVVHGHKDFIKGLAVDRVNSVVYTSDVAGQVCKWDTSSGVGAWFAGKGSGGKPVSSVGVSADQKTLTTASFDDKIRVNDVSAMTFNDTANDAGGNPVDMVVANNDAGLCFTILGQEKLVVSRDGVAVDTVDLPKRPTAVAVSQDDKEVCVGMQNGKVQCFSVAGDKCTATQEIPNGTRPITALAYSGDGKFLSVADNDRVIFIYDRTEDPSAYKKKNPVGWTFHGGAIGAMEFSPDHSRMLSVSADMTFILWTDFEKFKGNKKKVFKNVHGGSCDCGGWLDDSTVVTTGDDRSVKVWSV